MAWVVQRWAKYVTMLEGQDARDEGRLRSVYDVEDRTTGRENTPETLKIDHYILY